MGEGPLQGVKVVELAGIGPGPYACTMLADLGADVIRVSRAGGIGGTAMRGRPALAADLKDPADLRRVQQLVDVADVLVEGFRPGVAERLGLGAADSTARNPRLVYARMTGWGQDGPLASKVGHDINYLGLTGALHAIGEAGRKPVIPLNLVADFGGGAMFLLLGVVSALYEREHSGRGQVVDAAMVDGVASLMSMTWQLVSAGMWRDERAANLLDGGAPFYDTYTCSDDRYLAVGAIEPQFYAALGATLGVELPPQHDTAQWPRVREILTETFARQPREHWVALFADVEACVTPVLSLTEAPQAEHLAARGTLLSTGAGVQPGVAPRFSRTPGAAGEPGAPPGELDAEVLARWGIDRRQWAGT